jgi:hypothetical protein
MPDNGFHRDASGRLTFEMFRVPGDSCPAITKEVVVAFNLVPAGTLVVGWDMVSWDYQQGEAVVGLEWDNWSGFIVTAKNSLAEPVVEEIGAYLLASSWAKLGATSEPPVA